MNHSDLKKYPQTQAAFAYAHHVIKGHRCAGKWEILACKRFLNDLEKVGQDDFKWTYNYKKAERACNFIEKLPHTKGRWAAKQQNIDLEPWQIFIVCNIFGWMGADGFRRFREIYLEVARKNGKSLLAAAVGIYMFCADDEYCAEVYSGATTEKQAYEVFRPAKIICQKKQSLLDRYGIEVNAKNLNIASDNSKFEPIVGNPGDGASPSCAIIDEYHEHPKDDLYDTMQTGMGAREQPLMVIITTAGSNLYGPCDDKRREIEKILDGVYEDDRKFGIRYTADDDDAWDSEKALEKANPNIGVSISREWLLNQLDDAKRKASKQNTFRCKHLNQWVGAGTSWLNMLDWQSCGDSQLSINDFKETGCIVAVDLASKVDIAALIYLFLNVIDGLPHYYVFPKFYLPEETIRESRNQQYTGWVNNGYLTATPGNIIDYDVIENDLLQDRSYCEIREIAYDPFQATQFVTRMQAEGFDMIEYGATVKNFSEPMKELEALVIAGRFHHPNNPVMTWMMSNVVAFTDQKDNIYPRKETKNTPLKIDGAVAAIMALGRYMAFVEEGHAYEDRGFAQL